MSLSTTHGEALLSAHLRSGRYRSPEEVLTRALESLAEKEPPPAQRKKTPAEAVADIRLMARRRGRVTADQISEFIDDLAALPIRIEPPSDPAEWPAILALAETHQLTAYDAAYPELVQRTGLPLATLDGDLRQAAQAESAPLVEQA
jgi:predicted nucleic acid-binding protein